MSQQPPIKPVQLHTDLNKRAVVYSASDDWLATPMPGVERRYLERDGGEHVRRATSIVRYAPGSRYAPHTHHGGEEFLVLKGTFSDEAGDYPEGTYVRNPCGSSHEPFSTQGCIIFVKLCQMDPRDTLRVCITPQQYRWTTDKDSDIETMPLHSFGKEEVRLERWKPGTTLARHTHPGGEEILVIEGTLHDEGGTYTAGSWLRNPPHSEHAPRSDEGCLLYVKKGHLLETSRGQNT